MSSSSNTQAEFQLPLVTGRTAVWLYDTLDLVGKSTTVYRVDTESTKFSTDPVSEKHISLQGIPYHHEMWLIDNGCIPELRRNEKKSERKARQLESVTFKLGSFQVSQQSKNPIDKMSRINLTRKDQGYENSWVDGYITAVPVIAIYTHGGKRKLIDEFTSDAWKGVVLGVQRKICVEGTGLNEWMSDQELILASSVESAVKPFIPSRLKIPAGTADLPIIEESAGSYRTRSQSNLTGHSDRYSGRPVHVRIEM